MGNLISIADERRVEMAANRPRIGLDHPTVVPGAAPTTTERLPDADVDAARNRDVDTEPNRNVGTDARVGPAVGRTDRNA
jgi:hypothetical protein